MEIKPFYFVILHPHILSFLIHIVDDDNAQFSYNMRCSLPHCSSPWISFLIIAGFAARPRNLFKFCQHKFFVFVAQKFMTIRIFCQLCEEPEEFSWSGNLWFLVMLWQFYFTKMILKKLSNVLQLSVDSTRSIDKCK